jgi:response regulator RpfG family c-di-GMP phosphodiesterase
LTLLLAESLERHGRGTYTGTRFSPRDIQELRYAAILHDFGKVGVRESVLVKADKLYPWQLEILASRFDLARKDRQLESYRRRLLATSAGKPAAQVNVEEDEWLLQALNELDQAQEFVLACNRPSLMEGGRFERLAAMAQISFLDSRNQPQPLLSESELKLLSLPRGTLSESERAEIESHVAHTFRFLSQIPWARALRRVPEIAFAHHEKLDGSGYPRGLSREQIPVQSRMMTIADIYDALTAADRPYKKAVPHPLALEILQKEADRQQLDGELLRIFIEAEVPRRALSAP